MAERRSNSSSELRVAVDTGGTFTDCVWLEDNQLRMLKVFSTPQDPSRAIVEALQKIMEAGRPRRDLVLLHGTTVGTNTLLQRKGARVAFVTTKGFEDTIEIGRQVRPRLYDFFFDRIPPLVPPELRFGVEERIGPEGEVVREIGDLDSLKEEVRSAKAEAIAISFLFSFANPSHEKQAVEALRDLRVPLSISHELLPEFREYERASTIVINAYLQPVMEKYLQNLAAGVKGDSRVFVMQSSGGITSVEVAAHEPVRTVLSGPAGGVVGAAAMARLSGFEKVIGFDMGGTSTDVCLVDGEAKATNEGEVAGLPVRVPMLDIHTVGAGGGSIARFDAAGALRVGPESAGADPGPICYGRGDQPTVTDANLLLGRLRPDAFLGGEFTLDLDRTRKVVREWLEQSGSKLSVQKFAEGVIRVVNSAMEKAIRVVSIERGYDPRDFALVAFGGAGGLHACELAQSLGIPTVIVPEMPGALSAYGILVSDIVKDYSRTVLLRAKQSVPRVQLENEFRTLVRKAEKVFRAEKWQGKMALARSADLRYRGQGYELNVEYSARMLDDFHGEHKRRYGYSNPGREVEIVTVRLRATLPGTKAPLRRRRRDRTEAPATQDKSTILRESLSPGKRYRGPVVITEYSATTFVPDGWHFHVDMIGNLIVRKK